MSCHIVGIHSSPRQGATAYALLRALEYAEEVPGVTTSFHELRQGKLSPCIHCDRCKDLFHCPVFDDAMQVFYELLPKSQGVILASPVYDMGISPLMSAFLSRLRPLGKLTARSFATQVGGAIAVSGARNGGIEEALGIMNRALMSHGMCLAGGSIFAYSGGGIWSKDRKEEGAMEDKLGMRTGSVMARRVAVMAKLLQAGRDALPQLTEAQIAGFLDEEDYDEERRLFFSHED